jgi:hypothetical protein
MIVDFPEVKTRLYKMIGEVVLGHVKSSFPLIRLLGVRRQHEGEVHDYSTSDGDRRRMEYLQHSFGVSFDQSEFETLTPNDVVSRMLGAAEQMAASLRQATVDTLVAATESTGNVLNSPDRADPENLLRMIENTPVDFNGSRANPQAQFIFDSDTLAEINRRFIAMTEEQRQDHFRRREEILDRKYAEYLSREDNRKLVD